MPIKPQFLKRKESRSGSNRGPSAHQPIALPLGHTGSHSVRTRAQGDAGRSWGDSPQDVAAKTSYFFTSANCREGLQTNLRQGQWHGRDCSNYKSYHLARLSVSVKINLKLFFLAFTPKCKVRYLHFNLTKKQSMYTFSLFFLSCLLFQLHLAHLNHLESICDHVHGYSFCPGYYSCIFMILK